MTDFWTPRRGPGMYIYIHTYIHTYIHRESVRVNQSESRSRPAPKALETPGPAPLAKGQAASPKSGHGKRPGAAAPSPKRSSGLCERILGPFVPTYPGAPCM